MRTFPLAPLPPKVYLSGIREMDVDDPINDGLEGYWPLDEPTAGIAYDLSPHQRHAYPFSTAPIKVLGPVGRATKWPTNGYFSVPTFTWPASSPITVAFWAAPKTVTYNGAFEIGPSGEIECWLNFGNDLYWDYPYPAGRMNTTRLNSTDWSLITLVANPNGYRAIYFNAVLAAFITGAGSGPGALTGLKIGSNPSGGGVALDAIGRFRIIRRQLTNGEIQRLYTEPSAGFPLKTFTVQRTSGTVYNESFTESIAAGFSVTNSVTFANAVAESVAAAVSVSNAATFVNTTSDSVALIVSVANAAAFANVLAAELTADVALSNTATFAQTFTESAALDVTIGGGVSIAANFTETLGLGFSTSGSATFAENVVSDVTLGVTVGASVVFVNNFTSSATLSFSATSDVVVVTSTASLMPMPFSGPRINVDPLPDAMDDIDVDALMQDPDFMAVFTVTRTRQVINSNGRAEAVSQKFTGMGSLQPATGYTYSQVPETSRVAGDMELYTSTRLNVPSNGYEADRVEFEGQPYIVKGVLPWRGYGVGYNVVLLEQLPVLGPTMQQIGLPPRTTGRR